MRIYNIHEAKTHLSRLLEAVQAGERIVIAKAGKPVAVLTAFSADTAPRTLGQLAGTVREARDCWEPDSEVEALFYGSEIEPLSKVAEPPARP